jgi:acyl carrier protein
MPSGDRAREYVIGFLAERLERDPATILPTDRLSDLRIDSLDLVEMVMALEDDLRADLPERSLYRMETVQDLIDLVRQYLD